MDIVWLFTLKNNDGGYEYLSTRNTFMRDFGNLKGKIIPSKFTGIEATYFDVVSMTPGRIISGFAIPSENKEDDYKSGQVAIHLFVFGTVGFTSAWSFNISSCYKYEGLSYFELEDTFAKKIEKNYPEELIEDTISFKNKPYNDNYAVPEIFSKAYIPLRLLVVDGQDTEVRDSNDNVIGETQDYYFMGHAYNENGDEITYDITEITYPDSGEKYLINPLEVEWFTISGRNNKKYKGFRLSIEDVGNPLWRNGEYFLDMPALIYRNDRLLYNNPEKILQKICGIPMTGWSDDIKLSGGIYHQKKMADYLFNIMISADCNFKSEYQIIEPFSTYVLKNGEIQKDQMSYKLKIESQQSKKDNIDGAYVAWNDETECQNIFKIEALNCGNLSNEVLELPFVHTSEMAHAVAESYYKKKYGVLGQYSLSLHPKLINSIYPGVQVAFSNQYYGDFGGIVSDRKIQSNLDTTVFVKRYI